MDFLAICVIIGGIWLFLRLLRPSCSSTNTLGQLQPLRKNESYAETPPSIHGGSRADVSHPKPLDVEAKPATRWLPQGEEIEVQGVRIPGGLLYVGSSMSKVTEYGIEPSLIDPHLPIQAFGDSAGIPYWPSYTDLSPVSRAAYLRWLAGGRCDPNADIGFVFLFFYGLERRALTDKSQVSESERRQMRAEVERLLEIYGHNQSFRGYAVAFLEILLAVSTNYSEVAENPPPTVTRSRESRNLLLRIGLGWMSKTARPIPSNWALAWVRSNDAFYERTPATRCREQFEHLFAIRYSEHFGEMVIKPNKTAIRDNYTPASASFPGSCDLTIPDIPDIAMLKQPVARLILLANACTEELEPYSRYLGRNPGAEETAAALALLPTVLMRQGSHPALERIKTWIEKLPFDNGLAVTTYGDLRGEVWNKLPATSITKRDAVMFSQCLARLGFGVEPDIRFGAHQIRINEHIVVFHLPDDAPTAPSAPYTSSTLLAHLGAIMAHADDQVTPEEEQALMSHALHALDLAESERLRLKAYVKWLLISPPEPSGLKKRIESLPPDVRSRLGSFLARLIGLDGNIAAEEVCALQKVYKQLGLDPNNVFADTHAAATDPIMIQAAEPTCGYAIPVHLRDTDRPRVDLDRVRAMEVESEKVSLLLRDIFVTSAEDARIISSESISKNADVACVRVLDLDEIHSRFVLSLVEREFWNRAELDAIAAGYSLMPEGAIDAVNEAALNHEGEPLLEGDDPIEVNPQLRSVIQP